MSSTSKPLILKPLAGGRVLDFTAFPPGGFCTVMLADADTDDILRGAGFTAEEFERLGREGIICGPAALGYLSLSLVFR
jgi:hypothetical protein